MCMWKKVALCEMNGRYVLLLDMAYSVLEHELMLVILVWVNKEMVGERWIFNHVFFEILFWDKAVVKCTLLKFLKIFVL